MERMKRFSIGAFYGLGVFLLLVGGTVIANLLPPVMQFLFSNHPFFGWMGVFVLGGGLIKLLPPVEDRGGY